MVLFERFIIKTCSLTYIQTVPKTFGRDFKTRLAFQKIDICHNMTFHLTGLEFLEVNLQILRSDQAREAGFNFKALSCTRGLASMILNRDLHCDYHYNDSLCDIIDP